MLIKIIGEKRELPSQPNLHKKAQGWLATIGDDLSGPDIVGVDPVEATATSEAQDPSAGPPGAQAVEVPRPPQVEQSDIIETTHTRTLDLEATTRTLVPDTHSLTLVTPNSCSFVTSA